MSELARIHPFTGEVLDLVELGAAELDELLGQAADAHHRLGEFETAIRDELAARADELGRRKVELGGVEYEVNAPTEDVYTVENVREELEPLVERGVVPAAVLRELVVYPPPSRPAARVDRRRVALLLKSTNAELVAALERARRRRNTTRTVKIIRRAISGSSEEVSP